MAGINLGTSLERHHETLKHSCLNAAKRKLKWMQNGGEKGIEIDDILVREIGVVPVASANEFKHLK